MQKQNLEEIRKNWSDSYITLEVDGPTPIYLVEDKAKESFVWHFIHNVIVHPLIGVFGWNRWTEYLHETTGNKWDKK